MCSFFYHNQIHVFLPNFKHRHLFGKFEIMRHPLDCQHTGLLLTLTPPQTFVWLINKTKYAHNNRNFWSFQELCNFFQGLFIDKGKKSKTNAPWVQPLSSRLFLFWLEKVCAIFQNALVRIDYDSIDDLGKYCYFALLTKLKYEHSLQLYSSLPNKRCAPNKSSAVTIMKF